MEGSGAVPAEPGLRDVLELATRAFHEKNPLLTSETFPNAESLIER
jgi:hypothetical protein